MRPFPCGRWRRRTKEWDFNLESKTEASNAPRLNVCCTSYFILAQPRAQRKTWINISLCLSALFLYSSGRIILFLQVVFVLEPFFLIPQQVFDGNRNVYKKLEARDIRRQRGLFDTIKYNVLSRPVTTKYMRIRPVKKENGGFPVSLRLELYGCAAGKIVTVFPQLFPILSYSSSTRLPAWEGLLRYARVIFRKYGKVILALEALLGDLMWRSSSTVILLEISWEGHLPVWFCWEISCEGHLPLWFCWEISCEGHLPLWFREEARCSFRRKGNKLRNINIYTNKRLWG